jgi:DnaJ-class molecular chaperone
MAFCNTCPDCDGPAIDLGYGAGNGKCSVCHGTGFGGIVDQIAAGLVGKESECWKCGGSGDCQTCGGSGEL